MSVVEQLESRTLLAVNPWGETLYSGTPSEVKLLTGGDMVVLENGTITRLAPDGTTIWQKQADVYLDKATVSLSGSTDVIWIKADSGEGLVLRVSPEGEIQTFEQPFGFMLAALSDGRLAMATGETDAVLGYRDADGLYEPVSADLSSFHVTDIAADAHDNIFVVGYSETGRPADPSGLEDDPYTYNGIIRKYDSSGKLLWQRGYDVGDSDMFRDVDVDESGNAWVAARIEPQGEWMPYRFGEIPGETPAYVRAICYGPDGSLLGSPIVYQSVGVFAQFDQLTISASHGRAILSFRDIKQPTAFLAEVEGNTVLWKAAFEDTWVGEAVLTNDSKLLYPEGDEVNFVLVRSNDYRNGSTFVVPATSSDDLITVEDKGDRVVAHRGADRIVTYTAGLTDVSARLLEGDDCFTAQTSLNVTADGGRGNDTIITGHGQDTIYGGDGNDLIKSHGGADSVLGGRGRDTVRGGAGPDSIDGEGGKDLLYGETVRNAAATADTQQNAGDSIIGGGGNDVIFGGPGNDTIYGSEDDDSISGGRGDDQLAGSTGNDTLLGGTGNDTISGGEGGDRIDTYGAMSISRGGDGDDQISSPGGGVMYGGPGCDAFSELEVDQVMDRDWQDVLLIPL